MVGLKTTWILCILALTHKRMSAAYEQGIDVSHYQGTVDWSKVRAAGITFAIAKATESNSYEDNTFVQNWNGMKANNIEAAAYHYFRGAVCACKQIEHIKQVLTKVGFNGNYDVLVIDVEENGNNGNTPDQMADTLNTLLEGLRPTYRNIYIYTGPNYWENKVSWSKYDFSKYPLWIAHYTTQSPRIPTTWKDIGYRWWQYSDKGTVSGISGFVDMNRGKD